MTDGNQQARSGRAIKALILSPAVLLVAAACRLLLITNYDTTTATAVTVAGGFTGTLLGTLVPLLPVFLPAITIALIMGRYWQLAALSGLATAIIAPAYATFATGWNRAKFEYNDMLTRLDLEGWRALYSDSRWLLICVLGGALLVYLDPPIPLITGGWSIFVPQLAMVAIYSIVVAAICGYAFFFVRAIYQVPFDMRTVSEVVRRPWIPAEEVALKSGEVKVGYALNVSVGWYVLLDEETRTIEYLPSSEVTRRTVCKPGPPAAMQPLPLVTFEGVRRIPARLCSPPMDPTPVQTASILVP
ncbi:hypothetical protein EV188_114150 [Actinomycetospora succinea]|uniref:Uncharacterized protein n=1 Tax=Actinomycetospora succinea TaxID=663603 RepID=A0A4R6UKF6_9PSEU|nr:hypothetical protein [Actinomycetospora succinea]TDQ47062.1 hypothetical protein EV188_114150 [Actinomycetospora succinea]